MLTLKTASLWLGENETSSSSESSPPASTPSAKCAPPAAATFTFFCAPGVFSRSRDRSPDSEVAGTQVSQSADQPT